MQFCACLVNSSIKRLRKVKTQINLQIGVIKDSKVVINE